ncbi:hypothetical protein KAR48_18100 [bacterium]|nr:hypothetical protein [bacterium]
MKNMRLLTLLILITLSTFVHAFQQKADQRINYHWDNNLSQLNQSLSNNPPPDQPYSFKNHSSGNLNTQLVGQWAGGDISYYFNLDGDLAVYPQGLYMNIVDFTNPLRPDTLDQILLPSRLEAAAINQSRVFASVGESLLVYDISNPTAIEQIGQFDLEAEHSIDEMKLHGNLLYAVIRYDIGQYHLHTIDLSNVADIRSLGNTSVIGRINGDRR